jgi:hypothetical protein
VRWLGWFLMSFFSDFPNVLRASGVLLLLIITVVPATQSNLPRPLPFRPRSPKISTAPRPRSLHRPLSPHVPVTLEPGEWIPRESIPPLQLRTGVSSIGEGGRERERFMGLDPPNRQRGAGGEKRKRDNSKCESHVKKKEEEKTKHQLDHITPPLLVLLMTRPIPSYPIPSHPIPSHPQTPRTG